MNARYHSSASPIFKLTEVGAIMGTGRTVQLIVVEVLRPEPDPAPILFLLMVVQIVTEMLNRSDPVTLTLAQVKSLCSSIFASFVLKIIQFNDS